MKRFVLLLAAGTLASSAFAAPPPQQIANVDQFGLRLAFPAHAKLVPNLSGDNLHGWGMHIADQGDRSITVLATWNTTFYRSPEQAAECFGGKSPFSTNGAKLNLAFPGHHSVTCLTRLENGKVSIVVVAQAWRWPDSRGDAEAQHSPWVNYYAYLDTTRDKMAADVQQFRAFLRNVDIRKPA